MYFYNEIWMIDGNNTVDAAYYATYVHSIGWQLPTEDKRLYTKILW